MTQHYHFPQERQLQVASQWRTLALQHSAPSHTGGDIQGQSYVAVRLHRLWFRFLRISSWAAQTLEQHRWMMATPIKILHSSRVLPFSDIDMLTGNKDAS